MRVSRLIHNQPYMIRPTPKEDQITEESESDTLKVSRIRTKRVDDLKDRLRVLVETPLFVNADLLSQDLIADDGRIL